MSAQPHDLFPAGVPAPAGERSEEHGARGFLLIQIGDEPQPRRVPTLKRKWSDEWAAAASKHIVGVEFQDASDPNEFVASLATVAGKTIFELVLLYDRTGVLGGRDWLEENADDRDLWEALEAMATATFPFAKDPRVHSVVAAFGPQIRFVLGLALGALAQRLAPDEPSPSPSSSSGSPAATDGTPTPSTSDLATSSSSSSGGTARSASSAKPRSKRP